MKPKLEKLPTLFRAMECRAEAVRAADGAEADPNAPVAIAISSETPVQRWFGSEILDHAKAAIDMTFGERGLSFLVGHDQSEYTRLAVGIVRNLTVGKDKVLRGEVTFSLDPEAQRVRADMLAGVRPYISVGYRVLEMVLESTDAKTGDVYRITRWMPGEVSTVTVPADATVGVGRTSGSDDEKPVKVTRAAGATAQEKRAMDPIETPNTPAVDPVVAIEAQRKATADALAQRNKDAQEIAELAVSNGLGERIGEFLASGKSPGEIAVEILKARSSRPLNQPAAEHAPTRNTGLLTDVSKNPEYSLRSAIAGAVGMSEGQAWKGFESECDQEIRGKLPQNYKAQGGIFVPEQMGASRGVRRAMARMLGLQTRSGLDSATATSGAELVFDVPGEFIELLRNMAVATRMGATVLAGLSSPVTFPKQTGAGTATWVGENPGSDVSESDLDLSTIALAPKTIQSTTSHSRQLLAQTSFDVEALIRRDMALIHALAIDKAVFHGSGSSNQPTGIYAAAGVNSKAMGGAVAFGELIDMGTEVALDNAMAGVTGFVTNPGMAGKLMQTLEFSAAGAMAIWRGTHAEGVVAGYHAMSTNQISKGMTGSTETGGSEYGIIFGNWADVLLGTWGALELVVDPYSKKKQGMIEVTSFQLADILLRHGESFCKATGATLA